MAGLAVIMAGTAAAQNAAPPAVTASAVAAVEALGKEVVAGRYQVAIDRMYPGWKKRMAARPGGVEKMEQELAGLGKTLAEQGITLVSFSPTGSAQSYEVWPGKGVEVVDGKQVEKLTFEKWLVIIPTKTVYRITQPATSAQPAETYNIASHGFQIAVADKGKNNWTFMDGSSLSVPDLRRLFITLPESVVLPELKRAVEPK